MLNQDFSVRKVGELIKDIGACFMVTVAPGRNLLGIHARPMHTQRINTDTFDGVLWFFTDPASAKVAEIGRDARVLLTYEDPGKNRYVCLTGIASVVKDSAKARELWNLPARAWWPSGPESPDLTLVRVRIHEAEYWDGPSRTSYMLSLIKTVITRERLSTPGATPAEIRPTSGPRIALT